MEYDLEENFQEELKEIKSNSLKLKLVTIKNLVVERLALENEFKLRAANLQTKYEDLYKPLYEERLRVVQGDVNPQYNENTKSWDLNVANPDAKNGIPEFWLRCIENNSSFEKLINEKDRKVLKHLTNIVVENQQGFNYTLSFHFSQNEFFNHTTLQRKFIFDDKKGTIEKIESTKIEWNSEDLNPGIEKKKKKIKKGKETKVITKVTEVPSFFNFFKNYDLKELENKEAGGKNEDDEGEEPEGIEILEDELDLGNQFRDEIIPYSIEYYLDVVRGEEDDYDDFEEEEEEEEEEKPKKGGKKGKK